MLVCSFSQEDEHGFDYIYRATPKKEVVLMGKKAFADLLASIEANRKALKSLVDQHERRVKLLEATLKGGGSDAENTTGGPEAHQVIKTQQMTKELDEFSM